jgi:hypothetical protein
MKIYNFIIDDQVKGNFSFQFDVYIKDKVSKLCRAIQEETLLMLESRVVLKSKDTFSTISSNLDPGIIILQ